MAESLNEAGTVVEPVAAPSLPTDVPSEMSATAVSASAEAAAAAASSEGMAVDVAEQIPTNETEQKEQPEVAQANQNTEENGATQNQSSEAAPDSASAAPREESTADETRNDERERFERTRDDDRRRDTEAESDNPGMNLFVTGIASRIEERELEDMFAKHGTVTRCSIMREPYTKESRGFGFVSLETVEEADAATAALNGQEFYGRVLCVERARRSRPRSPTPGKYLGPSKRRGGFRPRGGPSGYRRPMRGPPGGGPGGPYNRYRNSYRPGDRGDGPDRRDRGDRDRSPRGGRRPYYDRRRNDRSPMRGGDSYGDRSVARHGGASSWSEGAGPERERRYD
ncbi:RNA-binding protein [Schizosaccharomyces japonicus yFS275]|uniref:RNA-binding protein n=1 Tax=Schizosaccharomyces japonicus (strain yFS275 / FY16936) TaxID=402676 RepID=B6JZH8_SCHJY|nr:RNA-binding protein [Schizosaccharomyces japonicus yFS275]EEB06946.2 RNA-binding protein [Schizosaccharomyces japonicus yFS275]